MIGVLISAPNGFQIKQRVFLLLVLLPFDVHKPTIQIRPEDIVGAGVKFWEMINYSIELKWIFNKYFLT